MKRINQFWRYVGPLRGMHYLLILMLSIAAFFSLAGTHKSGWLMFPTLIAPATVPMIFFVLPLDMTMCAIMMSGRDATVRRRYRHMILFNAIAFIVLFGTWLPFYYRLMAG